MISAVAIRLKIKIKIKSTNWIASYTINRFILARLISQNIDTVWDSCCYCCWSLVFRSVLNNRRRIHSPHSHRYMNAISFHWFYRIAIEVELCRCTDGTIYNIKACTTHTTNYEPLNKIFCLLAALNGLPTKCTHRTDTHTHDAHKRTLIRFDSKVQCSLSLQCPVCTTLLHTLFLELQ